MKRMDPHDLAPYPSSCCPTLVAVSHVSTHLLKKLSTWFTCTPSTLSTPVPIHLPSHFRVLCIGQHTLYFMRALLIEHFIIELTKSVFPPLDLKRIRTSFLALTHTILSPHHPFSPPSSSASPPASSACVILFPIFLSLVP